MELIEDYAQFFTASIVDWKPVLKANETKQLIVNSLNFLHTKKRAFIIAFVIMSDHLHLIWQIRPEHKLHEVQRDFLKFTAQQIKFYLMKNSPFLLKGLEVDRSDRKYQIWQRNSLNKPLYNPDVFDQKLEYIHFNPVKAGLCTKPVDYFFSSANFYENGDRTFDFLSRPE